MTDHWFKICQLLLSAKEALGFHERSSAPSGGGVGTAGKLDMTQPFFSMSLVIPGQYQCTPARALVRCIPWCATFSLSNMSDLILLGRIILPPANIIPSLIDTVCLIGQYCITFLSTCFLCCGQPCLIDWSKFGRDTILGQPRLVNFWTNIHF